MNNSIKNCRQSVLRLATLAVALAAARSASADTKTTRFLQADNPNQAKLSEGTFATTNSGYTGTGYADGAANATAYLEWSQVKIQTAGNKKLTFRYAYTGTTRSMAITVNGGSPSGGCAATVSPAAGSSLTDWKSFSCNVDLLAGDNIIRIRGTTAAGLANIDRVDVSETTESVPDWGIMVAESEMLQHPNAASTSGWGYAYALKLHGIYLVYKRTNDSRYLAYVKQWTDGMINATARSTSDGVSRPAGSIFSSSAQSSIRSLDALDWWFPGMAVLDVYNDFPLSHYRTALQSIRNRFSDASNSSGGHPTWSSSYGRLDTAPWHAVSKSNQLWLDGVFMSSKYLLSYGNKFGGADKTFADDDTAKSILTTYKYLKDGESCTADSTCGNGGVCVKRGADTSGVCSADDSAGTTGLLWHAYASGTVSWPKASGTNHAQEFWCRSMGWFAVATIDVLEVMSPTHPERSKLVNMLKGLTDSLASYQDSATGRWFQLVNKGANASNWTETSCSAMYSYTMKKGRALGFLTNSALDTNATNGYNGVLAKIHWDDGLTTNPQWGTANVPFGANLPELDGTCQGTNIGDEAYYFARNQITNDPHGLGAFLMMYEYFKNAAPPPPPPPPPDQPPPAGPITDIDVYDTATGQYYAIMSSFNVGAQFYGDRTFTIDAIPSALSQLIGKWWIQTANASKLEPDDPFMAVTLGIQSDVYIATRMHKPTWMDASWVDTGQDITIRESATVTKLYDVYKKNLPAGTYMFGNNLPNTSSYGMYFVVADPND